MKSKITLNDRKRSHFKIFLMAKDFELPEDKAEEFYNRLLTDDAKRKFIYSNKHKGYKICVFEMDNLSILTQCIVNEFKTQNCVIYITDKEELQDSINIAKFLQTNAETIMADYKDQILEARDDILKNASNKRIAEA